ncbi:RecQ family ATP-dependent DNA helicase [Pediococcus siamensis]|uniref:RecQ family ATP-dependent DNA helicase n=1 Tax=Pediococcus siamensis TaxID=381829 RepID=UPI0039A353B2
MQVSEQKIYAVLKSKFGFNEFKPGQLEIIHQLCRSQNVLAVLPTGTGKSLIYQLFSYLIEQPIIVISPLLSLIDDQIARLNRLGETAVIGLTSKLDYDQRQFALAHLKSYRFLYVSPEMANQPDVLQALSHMQCGLFVIDEAHCLSQWGPDFRPDYLKLKDIRKKLNYPTTLMLTATATKAVRLDILEKLAFRSDQVKQIIHSVDRSNIYLDVEHCRSAKQKDEKLLQLLQTLTGAGIIYFSSKKKASEIAALIGQKSERSVAVYHGDITPQDRYKIQQQFMQDKIDLICATSAFGMGIDKNNVRFVIHYHMPGNLEDYLQEIGRAGRDQKQSIAILLYAPGDEYIPSTLNLANIPSLANIELFFKNPASRPSFNTDERQLLMFYYNQHLDVHQVNQVFTDRQLSKQKSLAAMSGFVNTTTCLRTYLLNHFDETGVRHTEKCCGIDQATASITALKLDQSVVAKRSAKLTLRPWQEGLTQLFHQKPNT